jgi:hypothetical protein
MEHQPRHFQSEAALPILNKVGRIAALPVLRNILGQTSPKFDMAKALNHRWILIANVAPPELENRSVLIANLGQGADSVTGGVNPRIDGEACSGDDKGAVEAPGLFTGLAIQSDGLSVVSSV